MLLVVLVLLLLLILVLVRALLVVLELLLALVVLSGRPLRRLRRGAVAAQLVGRLGGALLLRPGADAADSAAAGLGLEARRPVVDGHVLRPAAPDLRGPLAGAAPPGHEPARRARPAGRERGRGAARDARHLADGARPPRGRGPRGRQGEAAVSPSPRRKRPGWLDPRRGTNGVSTNGSPQIVCFLTEGLFGNSR